MSKPPLGRLEQVELRGYWANEALEFTPWLAEPDNLALLGEALNLELDLQRIEAGVGPFAADMVCRDTSDDSVVLVENQLEKTNHRHLGQILTYAAGLDAATLVWVAAEFTEEHRAAIDWFNRATGERFQFFGVVVELWRIGGSSLAPRFHVVAKPNDWSKSVRAVADAAELSESQKLRQEYWSALNDHLQRSGSKLSRRSPSRRHWRHFALGRTGIRLVAVVSPQNRQIRAQLEIGTRNAQAWFEQLQQQRAAIERELGFAPEWLGAEGGRRKCRVRMVRAADPADRTAWAELHEWTRRHVEAFDRVFRARIQALTAANGDEDEDDDDREEEER